MSESLAESQDRQHTQQAKEDYLALLKFGNATGLIIGQFAGGTEDLRFGGTFGDVQLSRFGLVKVDQFPLFKYIEIPETV